MRALNVVIVPIALFFIYLAGHFFFNPKYATASVSSFLVDNIATVTWATVLFCLGITFDFARRATQQTSCKQVHGHFFLWVITVALFLQLVLAAGEAIMTVSGAQTLIAALNGHEAAILMLVLGSATFNSLAYGIGVDLNS
jgi:hypothetical protein